MLGNTVRVIYLVTISLVATSVDACGGPGPNPCLDFNCTYLKCTDFERAACIPKGKCERPKLSDKCRCPNHVTEVCCHDAECEIQNVMADPAFLRSGNIEIAGVPPGTNVVSLGSLESGVRVSSDANGRLPDVSATIKTGRPFRLENVTVIISPAKVISFKLTVKGPFQPIEGDAYDVNGETAYFPIETSIGYPRNKIVTEIHISDVTIDDIDRYTMMRYEIIGCFPACEEAGGVCLGQNPENNGSCPPIRGSPAQFHEGLGLGCRGKKANYKCCRPSRPSQ